MNFSFDDLVDRSIDGQLGTCYVSYVAEFGDEYTGEKIGKITVTGNRDEITDFESALSNEAVEPVIDELINYLSEEYNTDIEIYSIQVKYILFRFDLEDNSSIYVANMPDGSILLVDVSAEDHVDMLLDGINSSKSK